MKFTRQALLERIDKEIEFAKQVDPKMALGMSQIRMIICKEFESEGESNER